MSSYERRALHLEIARAKVAAAEHAEAALLAGSIVAEPHRVHEFRATVVQELRILADRDEITTGDIHSLADEIESGGLFCGSDDVNVALRSV